jgi:hypothetical protein
VESIYTAIIRREAVESIESQRTQMIAALFANPNWDGDNAEKRTQQIQTLNEHFNKAIESIYFPKGVEPDIDWDNPFYAAAKRGLEKTRQKYGITGKSMGEVVQMTTQMDQEQIRARIESRQSIDQT